MLQLSDVSHEEILDEINQRDVLNFKENIGVETDDESIEGRSDGEESSEEDDSIDNGSNNNT